jgi:TolB-like protein
MTRWLWENSRAPLQPELAAAARPTSAGASPEGEAATVPETGEPAPPRLSLVVLPFVNIGGSAGDDPFVDGIIETLGSLAVLRRFRDLAQHGFCL